MVLKWFLSRSLKWTNASSIHPAGRIMPGKTELYSELFHFGVSQASRTPCFFRGASQLLGIQSLPLRMIFQCATPWWSWFWKPYQPYHKGTASPKRGISLAWQVQTLHQRAFCSERSSRTGGAQGSTGQDDWRDRCVAQHCRHLFSEEYRIWLDIHLIEQLIWYPTILCVLVASRFSHDQR